MFECILIYTPAWRLCDKGYTWLTNQAFMAILMCLINELMRFLIRDLPYNWFGLSYYCMQWEELLMFIKVQWSNFCSLSGFIGRFKDSTDLNVNPGHIYFVTINAVIDM